MIPHRDPFLFVHNDAQDEGTVAVVRARFLPDNPYIADGSPDPVVPRMLLLEAMAQAMAVSASRNYDRTQQGYLVMVRSVEFLDDCKCSDDVLLRVKHTRSYGQMLRYETSASIGEKVIVRGEIMAAHVGDAAKAST